MPFLEQAEMEKVAAQAKKVSAELCKLIDEGYDIVAPTASCGLMLKFEWALVVPDDANVKRVAQNTFDIDEYVVDTAKRFGLPGDLKPLPEGVTVHLHTNAAWGGGAYLLVSVMQPRDPATAPKPRRALGVVYVPLKPADQTLTVALGAPAKALVSQ